MSHTTKAESDTVTVTLSLTVGQAQLVYYMLERGIEDICGADSLDGAGFDSSAKGVAELEAAFTKSTDAIQAAIK